MKKEICENCGLELEKHNRRSECTIQIKGRKRKKFKAKETDEEIAKNIIDNALMLAKKHTQVGQDVGRLIPLPMGSNQSLNPTAQNHGFYCCKCQDFFKEPHNHGSETLSDKRVSVNKRYSYYQNDVKEFIKEWENSLVPDDYPIHCIKKLRKLAGKDLI